MWLSRVDDHDRSCFSSPIPGIIHRSSTLQDRYSLCTHQFRQFDPPANSALFSFLPFQFNNIHTTNAYRWSSHSQPRFPSRMRSLSLHSDHVQDLEFFDQHIRSSKMNLKWFCYEFQVDSLSYSLNQECIFRSMYHEKLFSFKSTQLITTLNAQCWIIIESGDLILRLMIPTYI